MNRNYDVHLLYKDTRLDVSAILNGVIIVIFLYLSNLRSHRGRELMVARIYNYLCNECLSQLKLWVRIPLIAYTKSLTNFIK